MLSRKGIDSDEASHVQQLGGQRRVVVRPVLPATLGLAFPSTLLFTDARLVRRSLPSRSNASHHPLPLTARLPFDMHMHTAQTTLPSLGGHGLSSG
jgi:hypothetical protein